MLFWEYEISFLLKHCWNILPQSSKITQKKICNFAPLIAGRGQKKHCLTSHAAYTAPPLPTHVQLIYILLYMKWMFTFAFICIVPFSSQELSETRWEAVTALEWGALSLVVVGATFICYILVVIGQRPLRPTVAGMYNYIQPLLACIVAILWGMDSFGITKAFAILLIFTGVFLVTMSKSRKDRPKLG